MQLNLELTAEQQLAIHTIAAHFLINNHGVWINSRNQVRIGNVDVSKEFYSDSMYGVDDRCITHLLVTDNSELSKLFVSLALNHTEREVRHAVYRVVFQTIDNSTKTGYKALREVVKAIVKANPSIVPKQLESKSDIFRREGKELEAEIAAFAKSLGAQSKAFLALVEKIEDRAYAVSGR